MIKCFVIAVVLTGSLWGCGSSYSRMKSEDQIAPFGELRVLRILGDRPLSRRSDEFFVSQTRAGVLFYPDFNQLFR